MDALGILNTAGENAIHQIAQVLQVPPTQEAVFPLMRAAMGADKLKIYDLALHCAQEADLCLRQGISFAGCLMSTAAVEAFLTLNCLYEQDAVEKTLVYRHGKKKSKAYRDTIADLTFDKLIKLSIELNWLSVHSLNPDVVTAIVEDFPQVAKTIYPKLTPLDIIGRCQAIRSTPGLEILELLRDLRNLIHPPRWLRTDTILDKEEFRLNCRLAMVISAESFNASRCASCRRFKAWKRI